VRRQPKRTALETGTNRLWNEAKDPLAREVGTTIVSESTQVDTAPATSGAVDPARLAVARSRIAALARLLHHCYPPGLELLDLTSRDLEASSVEVASQLQTTAANVDQRWSRMKRYASAFEYLSEHAQATDEQVVAAMDVRLSDETRRIIGRVRQYILQCEGGR
jgi:hypothetical protein